MNTPWRHGWLALGMWVVLLALQAVLTNCGNPEDPRISEVRITYWDAETETWESLQDGTKALGSQVRVQATFTDNTAVVDPTLTIIGQRRDRDFSLEGGSLEERCDRGDDAFFECELECNDDGMGHYTCEPMLQAGSLIRGDVFSLTLKALVKDEASSKGTKAAGDEKTFKIGISTREAFIQEDDEQTGGTIDREYRILTVTNEQGDPNPFLWGLAYTAKEDPQEGDWVSLRSGDSLQWERPRDPLDGLGPIQGDEYFQLRVDQAVTLDNKTYTLQDPPQLSLASLVKWNKRFALVPDARTGEFEAKFQLFDPRGGDEVSNEDEAPVYRFVLKAQDVPDQGDAQFRSVQKMFDFVFSPPPPPATLPLPDITVNGLDEDETVTTSTASRILTGTVKSGAGEVRSLQFVLSNEKTGDAREERVQIFPMESITLAAGFSTGLELSDWTESKEGENGGIINELKVVAFAVREAQAAGEEGSKGREGKAAETTSRVEKTFRFEFTPPEASSSAPALELLELSPALNSSGEALLPVKNGAAEELRVWAGATDGNGQPEVSYGWCSCASDDVWNDDVRRRRCGGDDCRSCEEACGPCEDPENCQPGECGYYCGDCECVDGGISPNDLDASGRFPQNPWEWMGVTPNLENQGQKNDGSLANQDESQQALRNIAVFKAMEKDDGRNEPLFSAMEIRLEQETPPDGPFKVLLPRLVTRGPSVSLVPSEEFNAKNGELLCPFEDLDERQACLEENFKFDGADRIIPNSVDLNRIIALWNGEPVGHLSYDIDSYSVYWDLGIRKEEVRQGDRLCLGGESVTGHKTIKLFEFFEVEDGRLLVGVTTTSDLCDCTFGQPDPPFCLSSASADVQKDLAGTSASP